MSQAQISSHRAASDAQRPIEASALLTADNNAAEILVVARSRAAQNQLPYSGCVTPTEAWTLLVRGAARLVDVRSAEELRFVGRVAESLHVAWMSGLSLTRNPRFTRELEAKVGKSDVIVLLCRSGKRSAAAAEAATKVGFRQVFNVLEGFEGDLDEQQRRGSFNGWRYYDLPWVQD